jgi:hypothetical protein
MEKPGLKRNRLVRELGPLLLFTALGFLVMGYHPGAEDDGVYLTAVKADLNPHLFPHDAAFFQLQMRNSTFDTGMAFLVRLTGTPLGWAELLVQLTSIFLVLWACWSIARRLFSETAARWAAVAMVATMLTLPVAGTALFVMDQYLHPRNLATALILIGMSRIMARKAWQAVPLVFLAVLLHPLMGVFGISFCGVLTLTLSEPLRVRLRSLRTRLVAAGATSAAAFLPLGWIFEPPTPTWLEALRSRHWFRLYEWKWYEWVGALAPLALFWLVARVARKRGETELALFATAVFIYGVFQQAVAMVLLGPRALIVFSALEPMRYLQLIYVFMALVGGAYLGRYILKARVGRWAVFLIVSGGGMCLAQRQLFPASEHIEFPFTASANPWLQAFGWIKHNTPVDAYFALDPGYLAAPGEDFHSFRALAERSQLADAIKDTAVITKVPELGPEWKRESNAQAGWTHFQFADFERLKSEFGVDWVLVANPAPAGLVCRWHNGVLAVCQIP